MPERGGNGQSRQMCWADLARHHGVRERHQNHQQVRSDHRDAEAQDAGRFVQKPLKATGWETHTEHVTRLPEAEAYDNGLRTRSSSRSQHQAGKPAILQHKNRWPVARCRNRLAGVVALGKWAGSVGEMKCYISICSRIGFEVMLLNSRPHRKFARLERTVGAWGFDSISRNIVYSSPFQRVNSGCASH